MLSMHLYSTQLFFEITLDALCQEHVVVHNIYKTLNIQCTVYSRKQHTLQDRAFIDTSSV